MPSLPLPPSGSRLFRGCNSFVPTSVSSFLSALHIGWQFSVGFRLTFRVQFGCWAWPGGTTRLLLSPSLSLSLLFDSTVFREATIEPHLRLGQTCCFWFSIFRRFFFCVCCTKLDQLEFEMLKMIFLKP